MHVKGVSQATIVKAATDLGFEARGLHPVGRSLSFTLRIPRSVAQDRKEAGDPSLWRPPLPNDLGDRIADSYRKRSCDLKRWTNAVCFHGHKRFFDAIFDANPEAIVKTCRAAYKGAADFERKWAGAGMDNVRAGIQYRECCDCYGG